MSSSKPDAGYYCALLSGAVLYGTREERISYVTKIASEKLSLSEYLKYTKYLSRVRSVLSMSDSLESGIDG